MSHITFIQSETAKPSMKVHIGYPLPAGEYTIRDTYSACKTRIKYSWWTCENHHLKTETTARVNSELPALLQTVFSESSDTHVTITLSPEQYNLLLAGGNSAPSSTSRRASQYALRWVGGEAHTLQLFLPSACN